MRTLGEVASLFGELEGPCANVVSMRTPARSLEAALATGTLVLDGGLSNQLAAQGQDLSGELWCARLLADEPDQIVAAHAAYLRAGVNVLITASYQASFEGFARCGIGSARAAELLGDSVRLARTASDLVAASAGLAAPGGVARSAGLAAPAWVAASVGPYGAALADGSEYRGRYGLSVPALERFHRPRVEALAAAAPDVLALETVPDAEEAEAMLGAARGTDVPLWLSYTINGDRTRAGQPLDEAFAVARGNDQVIAVGVNCCDPRDVGQAIGIAVQVTGKPAVAYPNSGERWDAAAGQWRGHRHFDPGLVSEWRAAGAVLIGGCCRVGPAEIASLAVVLDAGVP